MGTTRSPRRRCRRGSGRRRRRSGRPSGSPGMGGPARPCRRAGRGAPPPARRARCGAASAAGRWRGARSSSAAPTRLARRTPASASSATSPSGRRALPAARYRAASASNSATRSATRRASATTDPVSACRGPRRPALHAPQRPGEPEQPGVRGAVPAPRRGVACSSSSSSVGPGTKWIPRRPPASTRNAASAPRSACFTLPRHSIEHVVRSRRALDGARSRLFSHTACELSAQMERYVSNFP